ncbi:lachesin-like isoform X2 [Diaphorina citri]|uniref:Lachesin-like isoform X2 n=1 Tax=Diaphorina citri TaxID=121845 RepID=A0A3Q0JCL4_DIACI|nr:lachesin-like isoform X2 [Diaphorina citri]KAI5711705.1 hypothetical protein M8J75_002535 [Diaphorina citri]KAI5750348.1 hypothetical protein M8J76_014943 [Diaphorina citri]
MIVIPSQLIGARLAAPLTLDCHVESYPKPITFWTHENGSLIHEGSRYHMWTEKFSSYKFYMRLYIGSLSKSDFGTYKCNAKNTLGGSEGVIKVYNIGYFGSDTQYVTDEEMQRTNQIARSKWGSEDSGGSRVRSAIPGWYLLPLVSVLLVLSQQSLLTTRHLVYQYHTV